MKDALKTIAEANEELNKTHPIDLQSPAEGMCGLSAALHLFHHQVIVHRYVPDLIAHSYAGPHTSDQTVTI